jgi:dTDP-4-dehydrorhamnose reductase
MKILLFGKNGQVGWELQRSLAVLGDVVALDRSSAEHCGDLSSLEGLARTVRDVRPDVIVNAAAYTAVDKAESESDLAHAVNAEAPGLLAKEAQRLGAWLVHYSTDYVFDGSGSRPWTETDLPAPLSTYGRTKLEGERAIAAHCERHLILRTSWVYSARGGNFIRTMLRLAQEREKLTVIDDQHGAPTGAELLADVTAHAIRRLVTKGDRGLAGIYHLAAAGQTTWNGYASHVLAEARRLRPDLALKATEVVPVTTAAFVTAAKRPLNSRLDTAKLRTSFDLPLPPWQQGVDRVLAEIL